MHLLAIDVYHYRSNSACAWAAYTDYFLHLLDAVSIDDNSTLTFFQPFEAAAPTIQAYAYIRMWGGVRKGALK
jgi:hypothetical protein